MDPDATYYEMFAAMRDGRLGEARQYALDLREWLDQGGFYPQRYSQQEVDAYLASVLRRTT